MKVSLKLTMLLLMGLFPLSAMAHSANVRGAEITLISILVVVVVFVLLYFALRFAANCCKEKAQTALAVQSVSASGLTDNELAAISIALYKYSKGLRENESSARLMNKAAKANSAWTLRRYTHSRPVVRRK